MTHAALSQSVPTSASVAPVTGSNVRPPGRSVIWFNQPAIKWHEALPLGNGRLGAMMFGGVQTEHVQLNEDTIWSGGPYQPAMPSGVQAILSARKLIFQGTPQSLKEANNLLYHEAFGRPIREAAYQALGDLQITLLAASTSITAYRRWLDLGTAIATTTYQSGGVTYTREAFASAPDKVIVVRFSADRPRSIAFSAKFVSPLRDVGQAAAGNTLTLTGRASDYAQHPRASGGGLSDPHIDDPPVKGVIVAHARLATLADGGNVEVSDAGVTVRDADSVTLLITAATNFKSFNDVSADPVATASDALAAASRKSYAQLKASHCADYQALFDRVTINLGETDAAKLPTDERVVNFSKENDPDLCALLFQFGRYLLIASSRPGGQPANLQGIWNGADNHTGLLDMSGKIYEGGPMLPAWGSKYTTNINTEMNYWPAETTNLSECAEPLFSMIKDLSVTGATTAKTMYGARGWVLHHNTDLWRGTAPVDYPPTGMWPMGGAWLCTHLWEHYQFTGDKDFLRRAYPLMKGASEFFVDYLVKDLSHPDHDWIVTCPSYSPENGPLTAGCTMDNALLRDLFQQTADAGRILDRDADFQQQILALRAKLPPFQIGKWGQLQEWLDDRDRQGDTHRHVSHLYGLFPSAQITKTATPDLFAAAKVSLQSRGDEGTGWSLAWKINFWARLLDGNHAYRLLSNLLSPPKTTGGIDHAGGVYPNLFDAHPPFQIDGNFGATAGIAEMLLQSHTGEIVLLPALPDAWKAGSITGLRARGGFEIAESWADAKLVHAVVRSTSGGVARLRYADRTTTIQLSPGESKSLDADLKPIEPAIQNSSRSN